MQLVLQSTARVKYIQKDLKDRLAMQQKQYLIKKYKKLVIQASFKNFWQVW